MKISEKKSENYVIYKFIFLILNKQALNKYDSTKLIHISNNALRFR